jgi:hypothetical protein
MTPAFTTGADLFGPWSADVVRGDPPPRFKVADPFAALDVRPGRLILSGLPGWLSDARCRLAPGVGV